MTEHGGGSTILCLAKSRRSRGQLLHNYETEAREPLLFILDSVDADERLAELERSLLRVHVETVALRIVNRDQLTLLVEKTDRWYLVLRVDRELNLLNWSCWVEFNQALLLMLAVL